MVQVRTQTLEQRRVHQRLRLQPCLVGDVGALDQERRDLIREVVAVVPQDVIVVSGVPRRQLESEELLQLLLGAQRRPHDRALHWSWRERGLPRLRRENLSAIPVLSTKRDDARVPDAAEALAAQHGRRHPLRETVGDVVPIQHDLAPPIAQAVRNKVVVGDLVATSHAHVLNEGIAVDESGPDVLKLQHASPPHVRFFERVQYLLQEEGVLPQHTAEALVQEMVRQVRWSRDEEQPEVDPILNADAIVPDHCLVVAA
mmetsp:Transcript_96574/g.273004  ORF Transcript_96574/g.273004 Transcript_96574/m.273004 type:complete len:258 (-) Transcript_96574:1406-2179(-)